MVWRSGYIAVDWGTTNRRAYLLDADGRLIEFFEDDLGLMSVPRGGFDAAAAEIRARLADLPMLLAGMVGSNRGWREVPYAPCPAGASDLANRILWVEPRWTGIVPGVSQSGEARADVMRGEEVQVLGAIALGLVPQATTVCHPGTHAKWVRIEDGRIASFRTMMTGELFGLITRHSILSEQLQGCVCVDEAFVAGVHEALAGADILSGLFRVRACHLLGESLGEPASYASGLLIGSDVRSGLRMHNDGVVALIGRSDLCALYAAALAQAGQETTQIDGADAFLAGMHMLKEMME